MAHNSGPEYFFWPNFFSNCELKVCENFRKSTYNLFIVSIDDLTKDEEKELTDFLKKHNLESVTQTFKGSVFIISQ